VGSERSPSTADIAVPGYKIIRKVADGGSASIFKAQKQPFEQIVALKVLLAKVAGDKEMVRAFEREGTILEKLKHKNIVKYGGMVKGSPRPTYEMELFEGYTLKSFIAKNGGKLPIPAAAKIGQQVAEALAFVHVHFYAHLDMKPENILVNDKLDVRIIDFSIARETKKSFLGKLLGSGEPKGFVQGTLTYLSPEQIKQADPGSKADVYALGLVLFEALTGSPPFRGHDQKAIMKQHLQEPAPPLDRVRLDVPQPIHELVKKALEKDPAKRPDMTAVAQVLAKHAQ
jgi:eukaryotic-like serine/threonine-protein kinase